MEDLIGYDEIIEDSMRLVIFKTLKRVEENGLSGDHYFIIKFFTKLEGVILPDYLLEKYPDEMTIVIQFQFKSLVVNDNFFSVFLGFNGKYENITVPYKAINSFSDPSMNFVLKFTVNHKDLLEEFEEDSDKQKENLTKKNIDLSAKIISLDDFRQNKKPK